MRSETHTLRVWSIEMAMPVPYGYGRRPLSSSDSYQRGQLFLSPYGGYHKAAPFGCGCLLGECYSKVGATIDSISKKTNSKICTFLKQLLLNWTDLPISHFVCVFRRKPPPDSDSFRHLIPIEVATRFRLIPPWESDSFRHPLGRG